MSTVVKDLGAVSAYAYAVEKGYTGTETEFAELMADYAEVGQRAEDAADSALESKTAAQTAANTATNKASEATTAAETATTKAGEAQTSAQTASTKASEASQSASTASEKASEATTAAETATGAATTATTAKDDAVSAKTAAETAQVKAEDAAESVSASAAQIATNTSDISELKSGLSAVDKTLENKANIDGFYEDLTAGDAEQLVSSQFVEDKTPYLYRTSGGSTDIGNREYVDAVVGGTVCWNQLIQNGDFSDGTTGWVGFCGSISASSNGLTFTVTAKNNYSYVGRTDLNATVVDHKYFVSAIISVSEASSKVALNVGGIYIDKYFSLAANTPTLCEKISSAVAANKNFYIYPMREGAGLEVGSTMTAKKVFVIDLTAMFGSTIADYIYSLEQATAGAGVAFFKKLFPKDYYPYNAGELKSVEGVSVHETVGFNQWDGTYTANTWIEDPSTGSIVNVNGFNVTDYIRILPNTVYYTTGSGSSRGTYFDKDKNPIAQCGTTSARTFTAPSNACYVRLTILNSKLATFCINLSDPAKNGIYEPYKAHSYPLDSSLTLRGIPKLDAQNNLYYDGDRYLPDGTVTRKYGVVDLGTLTWSYNNNYFRTSGLNSLIKRPENTTIVPNVICDKYVAKEWQSSGDKEILVNTSTSGEGILIKDSDYTDTAAFKAAMSGVMLVYELATPTTEEATPYRQLQICDPNGTEEFVSTGIVPVGHETRYPENLRAKIEGLPWDFSSLIAPTEKTATSSRNYTAGSLLIMDNTLYKATANIANGGTITVGTNVVATTLAEVIAALA